MEFFENGFLTVFPDTLFNMSGFAMNNFAIFAVIAVVALEVARRMPRYGMAFGFFMIVAGAVYATGATAFLFA